MNRYLYLHCANFQQWHHSVSFSVFDLYIGHFPVSMGIVAKPCFQKSKVRTKDYQKVQGRHAGLYKLLRSNRALLPPHPLLGLISTNFLFNVAYLSKTEKVQSFKPLVVRVGKATAYSPHLSDLAVQGICSKGITCAGA